MRSSKVRGTRMRRVSSPNRTEFSGCTPLMRQFSMSRVRLAKTARGNARLRKSF